VSGAVIRQACHDATSPVGAEEDRDAHVGR
jgi:hypothetical protein